MRDAEAIRRRREAIKRLDRKTIERVLAETKKKRKPGEREIAFRARARGRGGAEKLLLDTLAQRDAGYTERDIVNAFIAKDFREAAAFEAIKLARQAGKVYIDKETDRLRLVKAKGSASSATATVTPPAQQSKKVRAAEMAKRETGVTLKELQETLNVTAAAARALIDDVHKMGIKLTKETVWKAE